MITSQVAVVPLRQRRCSFLAS